eukprot:scaffold214042_cov35-Tisochrysis_lutea.AAC.1
MARRPCKLHSASSAAAAERTLHASSRMRSGVHINATITRACRACSSGPRATWRGAAGHGSAGRPRSRAAGRARARTLLRVSKPSARALPPPSFCTPLLARRRARTRTAAVSAAR